MYTVREHHNIKTKTCMEKTNLAPIETYITVCQLQFLSRVANMDDNQLTCQILNFQAIPQGKCTRGIQTNKRAYKDGLTHTGSIKKGNVTSSDWIDIMNNYKSTNIIKNTLELKPGTFKK